MRLSLAVMVVLIGATSWAAARDVEMLIDEPRTGVRLAGTLRLPEGDGPHPVVVFVPAAGAHPRDEARSDGRHWAELAEAFAKVGIGSLRYDNPGTGGSVNEEVSEWEERWTLRDRGMWALAASQWVRSRDEVRKDGMGLLGFIDGSYAAAMVAIDKGEGVRFVVMLSASGVSGAENLIAQQTAPLRAGGAPSETIDALSEALRGGIDSVIEQRPEAECLEALEGALGVMGLSEEQRGPAAQGVYKNLSTATARDYLAFEPSEAMRRVKVPVLVVVGGEDSRHVHPRSVENMRAALEDSTREDRQVEVLGNLGHFLEPSEGEERVFDGVVVERLLHWVQHQIAR